MNSKTKILCTAMATGICIAGSSMAAGLQAIDSVETNALVLEEFDRIHIETPTAADLAVMNVRIFGPDNELVLSTRTKDESVEFLVDSDLPDGEYHYETVSIFGNVDLSSRENHQGGETTMRRKFGSFRVSNGRIMEKAIPKSASDASLIDKVIEGAVNLAGMTLDLFVSSAHAADIFTAPGGAIVMEAQFPILYFQYGPDDTINDATETWLLSGYQGADPTKGDFNIYDRSANHNVLTFQQGFDTYQSINVDGDGDIHWANGGMNFDKGESSLSIGTATTGAELVLGAVDPEMRYFDEDFSDYMYSNYDGLWYNIGHQYSNGPSMSLYYAAPQGSVLVDGSGNMGLGMGDFGTPGASLEVRRNDGTAAILVNEQSTISETRNMFSLINKGLTKFIINNLDGAEWAFANKGTSFRISRQGSGEVEMELYNNGDVVFAGLAYQNSDVNAKTNIEAVDQRSVLERITDLQISQWQYKDALGENHIGPMAQDFYAAFGLGKSDTNLSTIDTSGVALAAIQALAAENKTLREQVQSQQALLQSQQDRLGALENHQIEIQAMMTSLIEAQNGSPVLTKTAMK